MGKRRYYLHSEEEADHHNGRLGTKLGPASSRHGRTSRAAPTCCSTKACMAWSSPSQATSPGTWISGVAVVPIVNLEWIQKIHRDSAERGYSAEAIVDTILRRMPDYINHITPQFSRTDINFQRVLHGRHLEPFIARDIPTPDESFVVIRFKDPKKLEVSFSELLAMLQGSFMSRRNSIVVPGGKMGFAMEIILAPIIERMMYSRGS